MTTAKSFIFISDDVHVYYACCKYYNNYFILQITTPHTLSQVEDGYTIQTAGALSSHRISVSCQEDVYLKLRSVTLLMLYQTVIITSIWSHLLRGIPKHKTFFAQYFTKRESYAFLAYASGYTVPGDTILIWQWPTLLLLAANRKSLRPQIRILFITTEQGWAPCLTHKYYTELQNPQYIARVDNMTLQHCTPPVFKVGITKNRSCFLNFAEKIITFLNSLAILGNYLKKKQHPQNQWQLNTVYNVAYLSS